ncbi:hypothetical protein EYF80_057209 [Liparis tanakae]|uniref:Uncharacterized protein n=1 Tax=Liparis tanakae TaxID=230148 RepID=A0A4Z2EUZ5_9TELE|nr:hypothetical protein EYF80_057209 [Liparis tanakae]
MERSWTKNRNIPHSGSWQPTVEPLPVSAACGFGPSRDIWRNAGITQSPSARPGSTTRRLRFPHNHKKVERGLMSSSILLGSTGNRRTRSFCSVPRSPSDLWLICSR